MGQRKADHLHATALRLLSRRALSAAELRARLLKRGFPQGEVERELERLQGSGLLADLELARLVVRRKLESGHGSRAALEALRRRQVEEQAAKIALGEVSDEDLEQALARALAKALARCAEASAFRRRGKVVRYLLSRGFPLAVCLRATENLGGERDDVQEVGEPDCTEDFS